MSPPVPAARTWSSSSRAADHAHRCARMRPGGVRGCRRGRRRCSHARLRPVRRRVSRVAAPARPARSARPGPAAAAAPARRRVRGPTAALDPTDRSASYRAGCCSAQSRAAWIIVPSWSPVASCCAVSSTASSWSAATKADRATQPVQSVDVVVDRGWPAADLSGDGSDGQPVHALTVADAHCRRDHVLPCNTKSPCHGRPLDRRVLESEATSNPRGWQAERAATRQRAPRAAPGRGSGPPCPPAVPSAPCCHHIGASRKQIEEERRYGVGLPSHVGVARGRKGPHVGGDLVDDDEGRLRDSKISTDTFLPGGVRVSSWWETALHASSPNWAAMPPQIVLTRRPAISDSADRVQSVTHHGRDLALIWEEVGIDETRRSPADALRWPGDRRRLDRALLATAEAGLESERHRARLPVHAHLYPRGDRRSR